jgi:hypothetical protein
MAYKTIGQLDAAASAESADLIEIEQSGVSKYASIDQILNNEGRLMSASGIKFPATQVPSADANTLDDYEEGTWIPGVSFGGGVTGIAYSLQNGMYTKIGRAVCCTGRFDLSDKGSAAGTAVVTGLPFVVNSDTGANASVSIRIGGITFANAFMANVIRTTTTVQLAEITEGGTVSNLSNSDFSSTATMIITVLYME